MPIVVDDLLCSLVPPEAPLKRREVRAIRDAQPSGSFNTLARLPLVARLEVDDAAYSVGSAVTLPVLPSPHAEVELQAPFEDEAWAKAFERDWPEEYARYNERKRAQEPARPSGGPPTRTTLPLIAIVYRVLEKNPGMKLVIAGHADPDEQGEDLSAARAENFRALLVGDRQAFVATCLAHNAAADLAPIGHFLAAAFGWSWSEAAEHDPTAAIDAFRAGYLRDAGRKGFASFFTEKLSLGTPELSAADFGALYDCYVLVLAALMGTGSEAGLAQSRSCVHFVDDDARTHGFGASVPRDPSYAWRSHAQRRVEILFVPPESVTVVKGRGVPQVFASGGAEFVQIDPRWFTERPAVAVQVEPTMGVGSASATTRLDVRLRNRPPGLETFDDLEAHPPHWPGRNPGA